MRSKLSTDKKVIDKIIAQCDVCYVGMVDPEGMPYVLPFNYGYDGTHIFLHSAMDGRKIDVLKLNNNVCIVFSTGHELFHRNDDVACSYGMNFRSVVAFGKVHFVNDYDKKIEVLNKVMEKYTGKTFTYNSPAVNNVEAFIVEIESVTAKEAGY